MGVGKKVKDRKQRALVGTDGRTLTLQAHADSIATTPCAARRLAPSLPLYPPL
jgi:hypothetical protein